MFIYCCSLHWIKYFFSKTRSMIILLFRKNYEHLIWASCADADKLKRYGAKLNWLVDFNVYRNRKFHRNPLKSWIMQTDIRTNYSPHWIFDPALLHTKGSLGIFIYEYELLIGTFSAFIYTKFIQTGKLLIFYMRNCFRLTLKSKRSHLLTTICACEVTAAQSV